MRQLLEAAGLIALLAFGGPASAQVAPDAAREAVAAFLVEADAAGDAAGVEQALRDAFAFDVWERRLLAEDAPLGEAERETFRELLPAFLARLYGERLEGGAGAVTGAQAMRADALVSTEIPREEGAPIAVDYRVSAGEGDAPLVTDILLGGTSYALLMRDQFGALLEEEGPEGLFAYMRGNED